MLVLSSLVPIALSMAVLLLVVLLVLVVLVLVVVPMVFWGKLFVLPNLQGISQKSLYQIFPKLYFKEIHTERPPWYYPKHHCCTTFKRGGNLRLFSYWDKNTNKLVRTFHIDKRHVPVLGGQPDRQFFASMCIWVVFVICTSVKSKTLLQIPLNGLVNLGSL